MKRPINIEEDLGKIVEIDEDKYILCYIDLCGIDGLAGISIPEYDVVYLDHIEEAEFITEEKVK